jgi:hypothetical protein
MEVPFSHNGLATGISGFYYILRGVIKKALNLKVINF